MKNAMLQVMLFYSSVWGYKNLSQDTLANWLKTSPPFDFVLIDVRTASEVASSGMIGNDRCKPYNIAWTDNFKKYAPSLLKQQQIVLYCQSGNRAGQAARYLDTLGYENVYNVGGFTTWATRDASLKLKISDTMAVSQLPAVSMRAAITHVQYRSSGAKQLTVLQSGKMVMINQSVKPVQNGRYFTSDGRIIPMVSNNRRKFSQIVVSKRPQ